MTRPERLRHVLISWRSQDINHQAFVKYRPMKDMKVEDWIHMYCHANDIKGPVFMIENSTGVVQHTRII